MARAIVYNLSLPIYHIYGIAPYKDNGRRRGSFSYRSLFRARVIFHVADAILIFPTSYSTMYVLTLFDLPSRPPLGTA